MDVLSPMDWTPEFCFCGKKTVESHEFWFCSTDCARLDSLRSLGDPNSHYRNAYNRSLALGHRPPHMMGSRDAPPFVPPTNMLHHNVTPVRRGVREGNKARFPTLSQVAGRVLTKKAGESLIPDERDRAGFPNAPLRGHSAQRRGDYLLPLGPTAVLGRVPARTLRRPPVSTESLGNGTGRTPAGGAPNFGRSQEGDNSGGFNHKEPTIRPARNGSLPSDEQINPDSVRTTKALRRSASIGGWNATSRIDPSTEQDPLLNIIEEMRKEISAENFDPRSLFDEEEPY